jgi:protocatechuate 3,4-dioxygenase beta subunit
MSVLGRRCSALFFTLSLFFAGLLAGCGGGGGDVQSTPTVQSISLSSSAAQIKTGQSNNTATLTATVIGSDGKPMPNVFVSINADGNGVVQPASEVVTDSDGVATATLTYGTDRTNRNINVSASAGTVSSSSITVAVTGTTVALTTAANIVQNDTQIVNATVSDADGNPVEGVTVSLASSAGNAISPASQTTESDGVAGFNITPTTLGADTLTASMTGAGASQLVTVVAPISDSVQLVSNLPSIRSGSNASTNQATISATVRNPGGVVVPNVSVTFNATNNGSVTPSVATTDSQGVATATLKYGADLSNREIHVTATANGGQGSVSVNVVGTTIAINWPYDTPQLANTTYGVSILDDDKNPVSGAPVSVGITGNASSSDGTSLTTNPLGIADFTVSSTNAPGAFTITATYGEQHEIFLGSVGDPFTKIDANGFPMSPAATGWVAVRDNITDTGGAGHFWWEIKSSNRDQRDASKTFTFDEAKGYENAVNSSRLASFNDWQLPTASSGPSSGGMDYDDLLKSIKTRGGWPAVQKWFPATPDQFCWSSTPTSDENNSLATNIVTAQTLEFPHTVKQGVRLVRLGQ